MTNKTERQPAQTDHSKIIMTYYYLPARDRQSRQIQKIRQTFLTENYSPARFRQI